MQVVDLIQLRCAVAMQVEYKQSVQEKLQLAFQSQIATCNLHFATEAAVSVSSL